MGSRLGNEQMTLLRKMDDLKTHPTPSECSKMLTWGGGDSDEDCGKSKEHCEVSPEHQPPPK